MTNREMVLGHGKTDEGSTGMLSPGTDLYRGNHGEVRFWF